MNEVILPVGILADIEEVFGFRKDESYQERSHGYLESYEVNRGYKDTAVQAVVTDIARRAFEAGKEAGDGGLACNLHALEAELLETSAKCLRAAVQVGMGAE